MALWRSSVRSRLAPPGAATNKQHHGPSGNADDRDNNKKQQVLSPSSRGLGHYPFTVATGVRIPVGTPNQQDFEGCRKAALFFCGVRCACFLAVLKLPDVLKVSAAFDARGCRRMRGKVVVVRFVESLSLICAAGSVSTNDQCAEARPAATLSQHCSCKQL